MTKVDETRRRLIGGLAGTLAIVGPAALLGGCGGAPSPGTTQALGTLPAAGSLPGTQKQAETVKIALLLPLEAGIQMSAVAQGMKQAAELALFELNAPGLQLVVKDDKGTPEGAAAAVQAAVADGAELILGPLFGASIRTAAPIARQAGIPIIAFSNDPAVAGNGVYLLSFFNAEEATRVTQHAVAGGLRHIAALLPDNPLGKDTEPAFRAAAASGNARVALVEHYPADMTAIVEPLQRILAAIKASADSESPIDALFLPSATENVPRLVSMLGYHKVGRSNVRLLVSSGWDTPAALHAPSVQGALLAAPDPGGWREFTARFGKTYSSAPPRLASLIYDAVTVAAAFATQPRTQRYTAANLTRASGFAGIDGPFRFTHGGPCQRSLAVLEFQGQGLVTVSAPSSFPGGQVPAAASNRPAMRG